MKLQDTARSKGICFGTYEVDISLSRLEKTLQEYDMENDVGGNLHLNPEFQRGHVWTMEQREAYMESFLTNKSTNNVIYLNNPEWDNDLDKIDCTGYYCLDGLQRLTTFRMFLNNEVKVFGHYLNEYEDYKLFTNRANCCIKININNLPTMKDMIEWYIGINSGGTPHTEQEIDRVRKLLNNYK